MSLGLKYYTGFRVLRKQLEGIGLIRFFRAAGFPGLSYLYNPKPAALKLLGQHTIPFPQDYRSVYLGLLFAMLHLENNGFFIRTSKEGLQVSKPGYLDRLILSTGLTPLELMNALWLLRLCDEQGIPVSSEPFLNKSLHFDLQEKQVILNGFARFWLDSVDPWTLSETYFAEVHNKVSLKGLSVLDVGAQAGDTSLYFAYKGARKILAIEPAPVNYDALKRNISLNPSLAQRIEIYSYAIGPEGDAEIKYNPNFVSGNASLFYDPNYLEMRTLKVKSVRISGFLDRVGIGSVDVLKIDCKGCEFFMDEQDLNRINTYILLEYLGKCREVKALVDRICASGFKQVKYKQQKMRNLHEGLVNGWVLFYRK